METKSKARIQIPIPNPNNTERSPSSNSDSHNNLDSPHSPLRFHSPLRSDPGDLPETSPYASPIASPDELPSTATVVVSSADKFTQYSPVLSPLPPLTAENAAAKEGPPVPPPEVVMNRAVREVAAGTAVRKVGPDGRRVPSLTAILRRSRNEERMRIWELGFRLSSVVLCLISFSVMAADKTQGWSGDSFDRYKEYRYCLSVDVIAFVYSTFQVYDLSYHLATGKHVIRHHLRRHFAFFFDQILAYLLISAASSAAARVDDWQSNWGKDEFTEMATVSVTMAFLGFISFAISALLSGYNLCNNDST